MRNNVSVKRDEEGYVELKHRDPHGQVVTSSENGGYETAVVRVDKEPEYTTSPTCSNPTVTPSRNTWALDYTGLLYSVYFCVTGSPQNITWSFQDSAGSNITLIQFPSGLGTNPCQPSTPVPGYNATCQYNDSCYTTTFSVTNKLTSSFNQSQLELKHGGSSCFAQNISLQECSSPTPNNVPVNPSSGVYNTQANFQCSHGSTLFYLNGTAGNTATKCLATAEWENEKIVQCLTVSYNGIELKFYAIRKTYEQAKTACESDNAQLVVVKSQAMQDIITPHLDSTISYIEWGQYDYGVGYWMGLRKLAGANIHDYKALDGTTYVNKPAYTNWNYHEPNEVKSQLACAYMCPYNTVYGINRAYNRLSDNALFNVSKGGWWTNFCTLYNYYICQRAFCATNPCIHGSCVALATSYKCNCDPGYSGSLCDDDLCFPQPCQNGGSCNRVPGNYTCSCLNGFVGRNCETGQPTPTTPTTGGTPPTIPDNLGVIIGAVFGVVGALILIIILVYRIFIRPNKKDVTVAILNPEIPGSFKLPRYVDITLPQEVSYENLKEENIDPSSTNYENMRNNVSVNRDEEGYVELKQLDPCGQVVTSSENGGYETAIVRVNEEPEYVSIAQLPQPLYEPINPPP